MPIFIIVEKLEEKQRMNNRNFILERFSIKLELRFLKDNLCCYIMETKLINNFSHYVCIEEAHDNIIHF